MSLPVFLREAKSIHQSLKELLKTKEPFDKEVDFQRKRYVHIRCIFLTPVTDLWWIGFKVFAGDT
jgi:hypothetical protein